MLRALNFIVSTRYSTGAKKSTKGLLTAIYAPARCILNETPHEESWHFMTYLFLHVVQIV